MPLDIPMPWLRGPNTLEALSSGASAGASAGRLEQESVNESARLGMESMRLRQSAAMQQAQLQQSAEQHEMEFQARQKTQQQNQLREDQRLNIENAYKTSALGIAKGRLEETQKAAEEKAKAAALTFQDEQGFARHLSHGGSVLEGLQKFPRVSAPYLSAVTHATQDDNKAIHVGDAIVRRQPDGTYKAEYTAPSSNKPIKVGNSLIKLDENGNPLVIYGASGANLSELEKENLKDLRHQRDQLEKVTPRSDDEKQQNEDSLRAIQYNIERIKRGKSLTQTATTNEAPSKFGHPKVGEVRAGYRFKGGDPNDQKSWELVPQGE
jgi:hypothetical protein